VIGLDTNVLVRYLVQDDPQQSGAAARLIEEQCSISSPGYIAVVMLCELVWVLRGAYRYEKRVVVSVLEQILITAEFEIENEEVVRRSVEAFKRGGADFSDYVIVNIHQQMGCEKTVSFDKKLLAHPQVVQP